LSKKKRLARLEADALLLSGGKYWVMGLQTDEDVLTELGITLGPLQLDDRGRVKRARGLVVWGRCTIPDRRRLKGKPFFWGPDVPDNVAKDKVRKRVDYVRQADGSMKAIPHKVSEFDWNDPKTRKEVGADET